MRTLPEMLDDYTTTTVYKVNDGQFADYFSLYFNINSNIDSNFMKTKIEQIRKVTIGCQITTVCSAITTKSS
jgi:hypothetical protein